MIKPKFEPGQLVYFMDSGNPISRAVDAVMIGTNKIFYIVTRYKERTHEPDRFWLC